MRKALGKGLAELIPEIEEDIDLHKKETDSSIVKFLPVEKILFSSLQPRFKFQEDKSFEELVNSIKEKGVIQPIVVRKIEKDMYECIAGERRLRACKKLGIPQIPAIVKNVPDGEAFLIALIENIQRKDLNPLEEILAYKRLIEEFGYTQEEIAKKVGKDRSTITNLLRILKLPKEIQNDLAEGRITIGHAKVILSLENPEDMFFVRDQIIKKQLSVRQTEELVKRLTKKKSQKEEKSIDYDLLELSNFVSELIGTKVKIEKKRNITKFVIEFKSLEKVEEFLEHIKKAYS